MATPSGTDTSLQESQIEEFQTSLRGKLLQADDAGYDEARKVFNAMIDKRPAMIACCAGAGELRT